MEGRGKERVQSPSGDPGSSNEHGPHFFFFLTTFKYICLPNSWYQWWFSCPKYISGDTWRCWGWGIRNLSQTSVKIWSNCSESKESMQSHWNNKKQAFIFLIRKVYNPYQCDRIKNQLLIYPKEISEMCIKT